MSGSHAMHPTQTSSAFKGGLVGRTRVDDDESTTDFGLCKCSLDGMIEESGYKEEKAEELKKGEIFKLYSKREF